MIRILELSAARTKPGKVKMQDKIKGKSIFFIQNLLPDSNALAGCPPMNLGGQKNPPTNLWRVAPCYMLWPFREVLFCIGRSSDFGLLPTRLAFPSF
jgi:hypothetical protein